MGAQQDEKLPPGVTIIDSTRAAQEFVHSFINDAMSALLDGCGGDKEKEFVVLQSAHGALSYNHGIIKFLMSEINNKASSGGVDDLDGKLAEQHKAREQAGFDAAKDLTEAVDIATEATKDNALKATPRGDA